MVTIQDVAEAAHVSKATVSYVLAGSKRISSATSDRVRAAMEDLGYSVNHAARVLSTAKTMTLGIISPVPNRDVASISQGPYLVSLAEYARKEGYDAMLLTENSDSEALKEAIDAKKLDGAVLMEVQRQGDKRIDLVRRLGLPTVLLGVPEDPKGLDVVDSDFAQAARDLVQHLASLGRKKLLLVLWSEQRYQQRMNFAIRFREAALEEARRLGMKFHVEYAQSDQENPSEELKRAMSNYPDFDSLLIHNDSVAIIAPQVFYELGIDHSEKFSTAAIIPDQMNFLVKVPFPRVEVDLDKVAQNVIEVLVQRINNPRLEPQVRVLRHSLKIK